MIAIALDVLKVPEFNKLPGIHMIACSLPLVSTSITQLCSNLDGGVGHHPQIWQPWMQQNSGFPSGNLAKVSTPYRMHSVAGQV